LAHEGINNLRSDGKFTRGATLLGHAQIENTVHYLGVDVEDALELSERTEV